MRLCALSLRLAVPILLALLAGCAAPRYQTSVRLIPPSDAPGRACVQKCDAAKSACQSGCHARYQACVNALEPQVEARYLDALKSYELELKQYAAALRHYEMQMQFDWMNRYPFYPYWWDPWPRPYFPPPYREPVMPTREGVRAQLVKSNCHADCGCLPAYDTCFVGCGGQRVSETVCVENCPPPK
ncbi:MAG: hypothetical protein M0Z73_00755 [Betaproteobacteria bacterium]|nr:hypothetical protein [Betaproteobacteria bacterium]